ncbi:MAG: Gmad2 immunoglobulin-like domain-containing protein [Hyphomonadaceae bacterium]
MSMLRTTRFIALAALAVAACSPPQQAPASDTPATEAAEAPSVIIETPVANARVTSPLVVEGTAPGDWYFEAQFPAQLVGADGALIAEAPARAQSDWMTEAPVRYRAELSFNVTQETPATLVLQEDMPADNANPREVRLPVALAPAN